MRLLSIILIGFYIVTACGKSEMKEIKSESVAELSDSEKSLNITILLDLSDRLVRDLTPEQTTRDIAIVKELAKTFKKSMVNRGAIGAKDKMKVIFKPSPKDPNINSISRDLNIDLSNKEPREKKEIYDTVEHKFAENLELIYETTLENQEWLGSDIWRFFKNDVADLAIEDEKTYRNILVILSDGYLFHENSARIEGKKTTYITNSYFKRLNIYNRADWREYLESNGYGLVPIDEKFPSLEVLFLEVNPMEGNLKDEEIIRWYLTDWVNQMEVKDFRIYNTDLTSNTMQRINNFIN